VIKHQAIRNIHLNAVTISGDTVWDKDGNEIIIDATLVQNEIDKLQAEYDAKEYQRKRKAEYPDIYDYMDGIVKNDQAQIDKYIADAQDVKSKYPKGA
jgi:hypothetical protein